MLEPWRLTGNPASRLILTCDHAGNAVPLELGDLGLTPSQLSQHIAIDIGAEALAQALRSRFDAVLISAVYSRLVVDLNRYPEDAAVAPGVSDEVVIPGNQSIEATDLVTRISKFHKPYHDKVSSVLDVAQSAWAEPMMFFIHSFTPTMNGFDRPWHVGLLFHDDGVPARRVAASLNRDTSLVVGLNEPYTATEPQSFSAFEHAVERGLPYIAFEVRQDLLADTTGVERMADLLTLAISSALGLGAY